MVPRIPRLTRDGNELPTSEWRKMATGNYLSADRLIRASQLQGLWSIHIPMFDTYINSKLDPEYGCGWWVFPARIIGYRTDSVLPSEDMETWIWQQWDDYLAQLRADGYI